MLRCVETACPPPTTHAHAPLPPTHLPIKQPRMSGWLWRGGGGGAPPPAPGAAARNNLRARNSQGESRAYVGDLKINRKLEVRGKSIRVDEFATTIAREDRKEFRRGDDRQWYFTHHRAHPPGQAPGASCLDLEKPPRQTTGEGSHSQSNPLGNQSYSQDVSLSLDRHRDISPRRQTRVRHGSVSVAQRPGPDQAHALGDVGVHDLNARSSSPAVRKSGP